MTWERHQAEDLSDAGNAKTYKTNEHAWVECSENPDSKNYKGEKKDETKDKKEGGASAVTLKLDGIPSDLLLQLDGWDAPTWQCLDGHRTKVLGKLGWESWGRGGLRDRGRARTRAGRPRTKVRRSLFG